MIPTDNNLTVFDSGLQKERSYWLHRLESWQTSAQWIAVASPVGDAEWERRETRIPDPIFNRVQKRCRGSAFLTYTALITAVELCIFRYTGVSKVVVGSPALKELDKANLLAVALDIEASQPFKNLLNQARATLLEAYANQRFPFSRLLKTLKAGDGRPDSPFEVVVAGPLHGELPRLAHRFAISYSQSPAEIRVVLDFAPAALEADRAMLFWEHVLRLLDAGLTDPERPVGRLDMLGGGERNRVLNDWNRTAEEYGRPGGLHQWVVRTGLRRPDATAIAWDDGTLTYAALAYRAAGFASGLREKGVGCGDLVFLAAERDVKTATAVLAVLMLGAAYVPLDTGLPAARLRGLCRQTEPAAVLTGKASTFPLGETPCYGLNPWKAWPEPGTTRIPEPRVFPDDCAAYLIFTSGSTGQPKGVVISHRAIGNRLAWMERRFPLSGRDRVLQKTPLHFDASVWELFCPLMEGACTVLAEPQGHRDAEYLLHALARHRISRLQVVPSQLRMMLETEGWSRARTLTHLFSGGEALTGRLVSRFQALCNAKVVNLYGPTETSIDAAYWPVDAKFHQGPLPIGRPLGNMRLYVTDRRLEPLPPGVSGELAVGGKGLARGYLGQPAASAAVLVPDPFSERCGERLYKTGDRAAFDRNGNATYLGRFDFQVKLRGVRIELGEIEAVLAQHPDVQAAAVSLAKPAGKVEHLAAYVVGPGPERHRRLRAFLRERLSERMVPLYWVSLETLPLKPNGKLDRARLPVPVMETSSSAEAPRSGIEETLATIWLQVLALPRVGRDDNFFRLGGQSLLAARLVSRIRHSFQVELPLRTVFETPTLAAMAGQLERLLNKGSETDMAPLVPVKRGETVPLSYAQRRLWVLNRMEPDSPFYNMAVGLRLQGSVSVLGLERALGSIVARHEVLRTVLEDRGGRPVGRVAAFPAPAVPFVDLRGLAPANAALLWRSISEAEAGRPFAMGSGPLFRCALFRTSAVAHLFNLTLHHIVADAWSGRVFMAELSALYSGFLRQTPEPLPDLPVQYADFAHWQRHALAWSAQLDYWKRRLGPQPPVLALPTDYARPANSSTRGGKYGKRLPRAEWEALLRFGSSRGATPFMTLLAAFQALLCRYSGQQDLSVGSPVANRNRPELEPLIGFFVNTLVLRTDLSGNPDFETLMARVRETALGAFSHQDLPFDCLVDELSVERELSRHPLFQVMFDLEQDGPPALDLPLLRLESTPVDTGATPFDLALTVSTTEAEPRMVLEYSRDLFAPTTAARLLGHYLTLLRAILDRPRHPVAALPLMDPAQRHHLVVEWNHSPEDERAYTCLHHGFEVSARQTPDRVALVHGGRHLGFGTLEREADRVAQDLNRLGLGPEAVAGLAVARTPAMGIGILGILKAGGAFLPLDPEDPLPRLRQILEEARPKVLVTQDRHTRLFANAGLPCLALDALFSGESDARPSRPEPVISAENAAYAVFTSGSTGRPKGVLTGHRALANYCGRAARAFGLSGCDRVLQFAPIGFDVLLEELFPAWWRAAAVALPGRATDTPDGFSRFVRTRAVTVFELPAAFWRQWLNVLLRKGERPSSSLRLAIVGCEKVTAGQWASWQAFGVPLISIYGLSETSITTALYRAQTADMRADEALPIGRPIGGASVVLADAARHIVPMGVPGQILIGGIGLGRGYLHRPELTAARFVPDSFGDEPGARRYCSGDLARFDTNGRLAFLGRTDFQVKLRGFRIEPGEVETVLAGHGAVNDAHVLVREDRPGDPYLAAYVTPSLSARPESRDLLDFLAGKLPAYMVPSVIVVLERLPLTPNGKVDRTALPVPVRRVTGDFAPPLTPVEVRLAGIWRKLLGLPRVGMNDGFFALGGHSLLAIQAVSRINETLSPAFSLKDFFEAPTLAAMAERVALGSGSRTKAAGSIPPRPVGVACPLSFAQERLWVMYRWYPEAATYNVPAVFQLTGPLEVAVLERAFGEVVLRHEVLRTTFAESGDRPVQRVGEAEVPRLAAVDLTGLDRAARTRAGKRIVALETARPFDLVHGPVLRAVFVKPAEGVGLVLFDMHHIVTDEWSMMVLTREMEALYRAFLTGADAGLPPLPVQYGDYAFWQRRRLRGETLDRLVAFWRGLLRDAPEFLDLPTDRPRPATLSYRGKSLFFEAPAEIAEPFKYAFPDRHATLFMKLLALFAVTLHQGSGAVDLVIGTDVANRTHPQTERLIGFFTNQLALRCDLSGEPDFATILSRVRTLTLDAYDHAELPFERLVKALNPRRDPGRTPLFQVKLVLQNDPPRAFDLPGLAFSEVGFENETAKFDLLLTVFNRDRGLSAVLEYSTDLWDEASMTGFWRRFLRAMRLFAAHPGMRLPEIRRDLAGPGEESGAALAAPASEVGIA